MGKDVATVVEIYDAASGLQQSSISGHVTSRESASSVSDCLVSTLSRDGRFLAILHKIRYGFGDPGSKEEPSATYRRDTTIGVELIDLTRGVSLNFLPIDAAAQTPVNDIMHFSPDGVLLYIFSRRAVRSLIDSITVLEVAGGGLHLQRVAVDGEEGHSIAFGGLLNSHPAFMFPDGVTLTTFLRPTIVWTDLRRLTTAHELTLAVPDTARRQDNKFPPQPVPVFHEQMGVLFLANAGIGKITTVSLQNAKITNEHTLPLHPGQEPKFRERFDSLSSQSASLSADGSRLLVIENRGTGRGLWVLDTSNFLVTKQWLTDHFVSAVWEAPDGAATYVLSKPEHRLYVLDHEGTLVNHAPTSESYGFLTYIP
jgi:hypothetical protein